MRTPRALPVYPWGDNEHLEFGDGADYYIYYDGTNFLIANGTQEIKIDLTTPAYSRIYGGIHAGDALMLYANSVDADKRIEIRSDISLIPGSDIVKIYGTTINIRDAGATITTLNDVDLFLQPHGTGVVKFGTKTGTGDVAVDGYVSIKDAAGNAVKLATVA